jgi:hypothetical protein
MARDLGFDPDRLRCCVQVHETRIHVATADSPSRVEGVDAIATGEPALPLMCFSADCPLILLYAPRRRVVALAHSSWRCTVAGIIPGLIRTLQEVYGVRPEELYAGIGPSAGPQQYEVQEDVYQAASGLPNRERHFPRRDGRMFLDLWSACHAALAAAGVPGGQIECARTCTMTDNDVFYSFRREGAGCGHFGLMAGLA